MLSYPDRNSKLHHPNMYSLAHSAEQASTCFKGSPGTADIISISLVIALFLSDITTPPLLSDDAHAGLCGNPLSVSGY